MPRFSSTLLTSVLLAIHASAGVLAIPTAVVETTPQAQAEAQPGMAQSKVLGDALRDVDAQKDVSVCVTMQRVDVNYGKICFALPKDSIDISELVDKVKFMNNHLEGNYVDGRPIPEGLLGEVSHQDMPFETMQTMCTAACDKVKDDVDMTAGDCSWACMPILYRKAMEAASQIGGLDTTSSTKPPSMRLQKRVFDNAAAHRRLTPDQEELLKAFIRAFSEVWYGNKGTEPLTEEQIENLVDNSPVQGVTSEEVGDYWADIEGEVVVPATAEHFVDEERGSKVGEPPVVVESGRVDEGLRETVHEEVQEAPSPNVGTDSDPIDITPTPTSTHNTAPLFPTRAELLSFLDYIYGDDANEDEVRAKYPELLVKYKEYSDMPWNFQVVQVLIMKMKDNGELEDEDVWTFIVHNEQKLEAYKQAYSITDSNTTTDDDLAPLQPLNDTDTDFPQLIPNANSSGIVTPNTNHTSSSPAGPVVFPDTVRIIMPGEEDPDKRKGGNALADTTKESSKGKKALASAASEGMLKRGVAATFWAAWMGLLGWMLL